MLKDRKSSSLETWLKHYPKVKIISRDRYGKYINGASKGTPQAIQIADRKNGKAVENACLFLAFAGHPDYTEVLPIN